MALHEPPSDEMKAKAVKDTEGRGPKAPHDTEKEPKAPNGIFRKPSGEYQAKALTPDEISALLPYYADIGERPPFYRPIKRILWDRKLFRERRKLRKQLKYEFLMKLKPREFEELATEVGLGLEHTPWLLLWWFFNWLFGAGGLATLLGLGLLAMGGIYAWSAISELAGSFTVQINYNTMQSGFVLSETADFAVKTGRLISTELEGVNAMTLSDLPKDIDEYDGTRNGARYVAYSFYIRNDGNVVDSYEYVLHMSDSSRDADLAVWCMLFEDGHQIIYADASADGDPERIWGYKIPPFYNLAYDPANQYYQKAEDKDGRWGIQTTPFESRDVVVRGIVTDIEPGEIHRYTVVLWVEGYDPECTDSILDGYAKYYMEFNQVDKEKVNLFSNLYRTEFDKPLTQGGLEESEETQSAE